MSHEKQPKGLYVLCLTELWERFGFYTMQTILVLYMSKALLYPDKQAYLLYGAFSAMLFITPVIGGFLADRFMGFQKAILLGGILFVVGYALTAFPGQKLFYIGLSLVIVANGFFKPNVSSIVGDLYGANDARRDGGFTLFYMGINLGSLIPPLFTGAVVTHWGWHWGFLFAAFGLILGLAFFLGGRERLGTCGAVPHGSPLLKGFKDKARFYTLLWLGIIIAVALLHLIFVFPNQTNHILVIATILIILAVLYFMLKEHKIQRNKMIACLILILISVGFWSLYNQTFTSLMLFADRNMSKAFLGLTIDAEFTQFFNPFFIVVLSPILSKLWIMLERKGGNPSTPAKFSLGIVFMAIGFLFLGAGAKYFGYDGMTNPWWLVISYLLQTIGELLLSPIGLAMITRLSPKHLTGMMMGVWFLTQSAAFAIGGELATISDVPEKLSSALSLPIYAHAFIVYGVISAILAVVSFILVPFLNRLIRGDLPERTVK